MKFKYYQTVKNKKILSGIRDLLVLCDKEFTPPLSARSSTTQLDLHSSEESKSGIEEYFVEISKQSAVVATFKGEVVGFVSFKYDYVCEYITKDFAPNVYVSTIIVHPKYRHRSIASSMYEVLIKKLPKHYIFTRTWSTNLSHIRILLSLGFHEHCQISNDRGENIDTNYYRLNPKKISLRQYIEQYRLGNNLLFCGLLLAVTAVFIAVWLLSKEELSRELALAIATSLMASLLCLLSDTFLKIRESKNDNYINKLKSYGIENLQFNKNELLESVIPHCRKEIWISGCRLVMTSKNSFRNALVKACKRSERMHIKLLATPPWTTAYKLIYGEEDVTVNYLKVLKDLTECVEKYNLDLEVRFSEKPLFSDTYKVDDRFVTGPYLHCADKYNNRITAKDFFSLDITSPETTLYKIFYEDYMTLWNEAAAKLDIALLSDKIKGVEDFSELSEEQRKAVLLECCVNLN